MTIEQENEILRNIQKLRNDLDELKQEVSTLKVEPKKEKDLRTRSVTTNHAFKKVRNWLLTNYHFDLGGVELFQDIKGNYMHDFPSDEISDATFGKIIKEVFPSGTTRNTKIRGFSMRIYKLKHKR